MRTSHSSASVHLPLLVGAQSGVVVAFCLHTIQDKALAKVVEFSAPKGSLSAGSAFFAGLLQPFIFCHEGLRIVAASVYLSLLNLIVLKFHHSEGGVSASSDASEIQIVSSVHGVRQKLQFTALCVGPSAAPQVFTRVMTLVRSLSTVLDSASALSARLAIQAFFHE